MGIDFDGAVLDMFLWTQPMAGRLLVWYFYLLDLPPQTEKPAVRKERPPAKALLGNVTPPSPHSLPLTRVAG